MTNFDDVGDFHKKFGLDNATHHGAFPREVPDDVIEFRRKFMQEELDEFIEGWEEGDHAKMADALVDLTYVAMGTAHLQGYPWEVLWSEVQRANLQKVRASGADDPRGKRGHVLDVVKPEGWQPPDIQGILTEFGWAPLQRCRGCDHPLRTAGDFVGWTDERQEERYECIHCHVPVSADVVRVVLSQK